MLSFCTESAPIFQQLSQKSGKTFKIVAVLPESVSASHQYLEGHGAHVDQIKQMPLDKIGVTGTPSMLLIDSSGRVKQTWFGKLPADEQAQALTSIVGSHSSTGGGVL